MMLFLVAVWDPGRVDQSAEYEILEHGKTSADSIKIQYSDKRDKPAP